MSDPINQLKAKFKPKHRYANFGPVIRKMRVQGFRGIADLAIGFDSPLSSCQLQYTHDPDGRRRESVIIERATDVPYVGREAHSTNNSDVRTFQYIGNTLVIQNSIWRDR